jgi:hypothetical protein
LYVLATCPPGVRDSLDGRVFCVRGAVSFRCVFDARELGGAEYGLAEWLSDGRFELIRLLLGGRFVLALRSVLELCELGGENGFAERLSEGRFELIRLLFCRLLFCGRFALGGRSAVLFLAELLLLGDVAGR